MLRVKLVSRIYEMGEGTFHKVECVSPLFSHRVFPSLVSFEESVHSFKQDTG